MGTRPGGDSGNNPDSRQRYREDFFQYLTLAAAILGGAMLTVRTQRAGQASRFGSCCAPQIQSAALTRTEHVRPSKQQPLLWPPELRRSTTFQLSLFTLAMQHMPLPLPLLL